jgi:hypothetical protein
MIPGSKEQRFDHVPVLRKAGSVASLTHSETEHMGLGDIAAKLECSVEEVDEIVSLTRARRPQAYSPQ